MSTLPSAFDAERAALAAVTAAARAQLDALRTGQVEAFEAASADTVEAVAALDRCQQTRRRLAADPEAEAVSGQARAALDAAVAEARQACDALAFALEHAVALGRDLLSTWTQGATPPTAQVYTADGAVAPMSGGRLHRTG
ncbi:MAG: hypothetical protein AAGJ11_06945 [Bacteroidota bacterium]